MGIKFAHAVCDENGKASTGLPGNQSGKELRISSWYKDNWTCVLRCKDENKRLKMALFAIDCVKNMNIGYCQDRRNTLKKELSLVNFNVKELKNKCDCDCSSLMTVCAESVGINIEYTSSGNAPTTRTMEKIFGKTKMFDILKDDKYLKSDLNLITGDIIVKAGSHTAMVIDEDLLLDVPNVIYQAYLNKKWYPNVINFNNINDDGYAGIEGVPIQCIAANTSNKKFSISYRVHTEGKWLSWVNNRDDYAGIIGKNIDGIQFKSDDCNVFYRVSVIGSNNFYPWVKNNTDYAGSFGKFIDKLQVRLENK